ncbi:MAG: PEP-CTERM sorting domain-containing protein [Bryobacteraceae bacterium]
MHSVSTRAPRAIRPPLAALVTILTISAAASLQAGIIYRQGLTAEWLLDDPGDNAPPITGNFELIDENSSGTFQANAPVPFGSGSTSLEISFDPATATFRSTSDTRARQSGLNQGPGWQSLQVRGFQSIRFDDMISVDNRVVGIGFVHFYLVATGSVGLNNAIIAPPDSFAPIDTSTAVVFNLDGGAPGVEDHAFGRVDKAKAHDCLGDGICSFSEADPVVENLELLVPFNQGDPFPLRFSLTEAAFLNGTVVDATEVNMQVRNDLSSTMKLYADVYDSNMNLIPGLQVTSAEGVTYRNFTSSPSQVPEPGTMALAGIALLGLAAFGKRSAR